MTEKLSSNSLLNTVLRGVVIWVLGGESYNLEGTGPVLELVRPLHLNVSTSGTIFLVVGSGVHRDDKSQEENGSQTREGVTANFELCFLLFLLHRLQKNYGISTSV